MSAVVIGHTQLHPPVPGFAVCCSHLPGGGACTWHADAVLGWQGTWMLQEGARERRHLRSGDHVQYADIRAWLYGDPS